MENHLAHMSNVAHIDSFWHKKEFHAKLFIYLNQIGFVYLMNKFCIISYIITLL